MQDIRKLSVLAAPVVILRETLLDYLVISWYLPAGNNCLFNQPHPCFLVNAIVVIRDVQSRVEVQKYTTGMLDQTSSYHEYKIDLG